MNKILNSKFETNRKSEISKPQKNYDLEERTYEFAKEVRDCAKQHPKNFESMEDLKQLVRASGSVAANYIEANEALGKKDFLMRVKISKKESKESRLWLRLLTVSEAQLEAKRIRLFHEAHELMNILGAILRNSE